RAAPIRHVRSRTDHFGTRAVSDIRLQAPLRRQSMASPQKKVEPGSKQLAKVWIGIAVGAAVGIGIALSRRKRTRWDSAREIGHRVADRSGELAEATRGIVERVRNIYEESRKVAEDASTLWSHG